MKLPWVHSSLDFLHHLYYYLSQSVLCPVHDLSPLNSYVIAQNQHRYYYFGSPDAAGCDCVHDALKVTCCDDGDYLNLMLQPQIQAASAGLRCTRSLQTNATILMYIYEKFLSEMERDSCYKKAL
jgi:hypothetical protein